MEYFFLGQIHLFPEICKVQCKRVTVKNSRIDSQQEFAVWLRKLKQELCFNLEGWDGREMRVRL